PADRCKRRRLRPGEAERAAPVRRPHRGRVRRREEEAPGLLAPFAPCPGRDSNPHVPEGTASFKDAVSCLVPPPGPPHRSRAQIWLSGAEYRVIGPGGGTYPLVRCSVRQGGLSVGAPSLEASGLPYASGSGLIA